MALKLWDKKIPQPPGWPGGDHCSQVVLWCMTLQEAHSPG